MKTLSSCIATLIIIVDATLADDFVANGGLTGPIPATNETAIPSVPPGWAAGNGNVDMHESGGVDRYGDQFPISVGGTEFISGVGGDYPTGTTNESFFQNISNLVVGQEYQLSFYQANIGINPAFRTFQYMAAGYWQVRFGSTAFNSTLMPFVGFGADDFSVVTTSFIAASSTQKLEFIARDDGVIDSNFSYIAIDDIGLVIVPEPSTTTMVGVGVLAFSMIRRRAMMPPAGKFLC